jgi:hypothetical protein
MFGRGGRENVCALFFFLLFVSLVKYGFCEGNKGRRSQEDISPVDFIEAV